MRKRLMSTVTVMSFLVMSLVVMSGLALITLFAGPGVVPAATAQTELDLAQAKVAEATDRIEGVLDDLERTQQRGDDLALEFWQVQGDLEKLDIEIAANEQVVAELATEVEVLRSDVRSIALDRYVNRSEDITGVDHASEADRAAAETLARIVVGVEVDSLDSLAVLGADYEDQRAALNAQRAEQATIAAEVQETQESIVEELERLTSLRASLDGQLADLQEALAELEAIEAERLAAEERERLAAERARAQAAIEAAAAKTAQVPTPVPQPTPAPTPVPTVTPTAVPNPQPSEPFPTAEPTATVVPNPQPSEPLPTPVPVVPAAGGGIVCPLAGPFTHTDDFNAPRAVGGIHRANDLLAAQGTPVLAAASGAIEHRDSRVGGLSAHLKADNGDYYFYTHLSGYENVGAGRVAAGTVIGYVGMTGNAPIPHLHFEIHRGGYGNYTNPYGPVRTACFG